MGCLISICGLSAYNSFPEGHQLVILKSYFDGSGKSADRQCRFLTLVGYAAPPTVWPAFEAKWEDLLKKYHVKSFHTNEEQCCGNPLLVAELLDAIEKARHFGMRTVGAILDLEAHRKLSLEYPLPAPGRICAEHCINELLQQADSISCFFDRGEEFFKEVNRYWERDDITEPWPQLLRVHELGQVRQGDFPGIQAADLLAWHVNRSLTKSDYDLDLALIDARAPGMFKPFDEEALGAKYGKA